MVIINFIKDLSVFVGRFYFFFNKFVLELFIIFFFYMDMVDQSKFYNEIWI